MTEHDGVNAQSAGEDEDRFMEAVVHARAIISRADAAAAALIFLADDVDRMATLELDGSHVPERSPVQPVTATTNELNDAARAPGCRAGRTGSFRRVAAVHPRVPRAPRRLVCKPAVGQRPH
jgi:hypothetical protein